MYIENKDKLTIKAKVLTNKKIDKYTHIQIDKYIDDHTNIRTEKRAEEKENLLYNNSFIYETKYISKMNLLTHGRFYRLITQLI